MASTSVNSLLDRAAHITARNNEGNPLPPPAVAAQSPFHEVLIRDLAAALPADLAAPMEAAPLVGDVQDWLAAGALYRWVERDSPLARRFLAEVGQDPKRAGLALAQSLAARMAPPPRDAAWHRRDHLGLALELTIACTVLLCRSWLFHLLGQYSGPSPSQFGLAWLVRGIVDMHLLAGERPDSVLPLALLACAALWCGGEAIVIPRVMEWGRQFPAWRAELPPPLAWRTDAFSLVWWAQATLLSVCVSVRGWEHVVHLMGSGMMSGGQQAIAVTLGVWLIAISGMAVAWARSTLTLGTTTGSPYKLPS